MHKFIYILLLSFSFLADAKAQENSQVDVDSLVRALRKEYESNPTNQVAASVDTTLSPNLLTMPADSIESWKGLKAFAYAKYLDSLLKVQQEEKKKKPEESTVSSRRDKEPGWLDDVFASPVTKIFLWILAGLFVLYVLYKLFLTDGAFSRRSKTSRTDTPEVSEEVISAESDFDALISQSHRSGNYRLAVRYQYLKVLHRLAAKNFIELAVDKTNYQYVREMVTRGGAAVNQQFQNDFAALTLSYEYVWYGEFNVDDTIYRRIETGFTNFNQKI